MKNIAVILPAYNEELTIKETILDFYKELPNAKLVVIDNNSEDETANIVKNVFKEFKINGELLFEQRRGKGNAIRFAFQKIEADIYIMADADKTYAASEVHKLLKPVFEEDVDMCIGDRIIEGNYKRENKRAFHTFGNQLVQKLVNRLFETNISDIMSGYRVFSRRFVKNYPILVEGFELETDMTLHALDKRFKIKEIAIEYKNRPKGSFSKLNTFSDGFKVIITIFKIFRYYKPFIFFTYLSCFFVFLSLFAAIPVFNDWFMYKYIYHVPLAILSTGLALISIIFFALGIILDAISYQNKLEFEKKLL